MHEALFAYLENKGTYGTDAAALIQTLRSQPQAKLRETLTELESFVSLDEGQENKPFHFLANTTYAGLPFPCSAFECRTRRIREMAYFATLYAERVSFPSPFVFLESIKDHDELAAELGFFISRLARLRPLFDTGVLALAGAQQGNICHDCYARLVGYPKSVFKSKLSKLEQAVEKRYLQDVLYYVERWSKDEPPLVVPRGPSSLVDEHTFGIPFSESAPKRVLALLNKIPESQPLTRAQAKALGVHANLARHVVGDILNQNYYSTRFGTGYLTDRGVDLEVIDALAPRPIQDTNALLQAHFSHELPVIGGLKLTDLLKIRNDEGEAFRVYRDSLTRAIQQAKADDPKKIAQVFADVVRPELNKIDVAMKAAKRRLLRDAVVDGAIATGFITVGLFSGVLPANIGAIIAGLGGYHFAERLGKKVSDVALMPDEVRNNSYYFLWKVTRHGTKR